jgi:hypothetical protein
VDGSAGVTYGTGFRAKFLESGKLPNYALAISLGTIVVAVAFLTVVA